MGQLGKPYAESVKVFSIIREPIDRLISNFLWIYRDSNPATMLQPDAPRLVPVEFTTDNFWNKIKNESNPECNLQNIFLQTTLETNNSQCKYLFENLVIRDNNGVTQENKIINNQFTIQDMIYLIKNRKITLSTMENRIYLLDKLEFYLNTIKNTNIKINKNIKDNFNDTSRKKDLIDLIDKSIIEKIKDKNKLDYDLYNYVKDFELKNERCLSYKDILSD